MSQNLYRKIKGGRILIQSYVGDLMGCGYLRVIYPHIISSQYRKDNVSFEAYYNSYFIRDHQFYKPFTAVQFQRAATKAHVDVIKDFRKNFRNQTKTAIYYEIDDLLMDINEWNYAHDYYKKLKPYIIECMKLSDGLIVSTDKLKEVYSEFNNNITVSPNHLPKFMWGDINPKHERFNEKEKVKILYHGSDNHFATKHLIEKGITGGDFNPKLINFIKKTVDKYDWIFLGGFPVELESVKNKIRHDRFCSIFQFPFKLKSYNADIGIAPLFPCIFNQCKCLVENTKLFTDNGIKNIKDINVGDFIWDGNNYKKVLNTFKYKTQPTIKLTTYMGYEIEGTLNHKLVSSDRFKRIDELKIGDMLNLSFCNNNAKYQKLSAPLFWTKKLDQIDFENVNKDMLPKIKVNERWGRFLGYLLGDGHISNNACISISCNKEYNDIIDDICLFAKEIGLKPKLWPKKIKDGYTGNGIDVQIASRNLKWWLSKEIGFKGRYGKVLRVPNVIWHSPKSVIKEFIRGLFEADGTVNKRGGCSFTTKDNILAKEIQLLLLRFNILSRIITTYNKKYNKNYYQLTLNRQACDIFKKEIDFISKIKKDKLSNITNKKHSNAFKEWKLKDKIIKIDYNNSDVYDIEVDGHIYVANGILSHNSNIKLQEYTAVGIPAVCQDIDPYKKAAIKESDPEAFIGQIERLAEDVDVRRKTYKKQKELIGSSVFWESGNNIRNYINSFLNLSGFTLP